MFAGIDDLVRHDHLGTSGWQTVDQARIEHFADVTGDRRWIHIDPARARTGSPFGTTVAHGALTLSLCLTFLAELVDVDGVSHVVNSGFDRVRFPAPVLAGARLRGSARLTGHRRVPGGVRITVRMTAEIEGSERPASVADHVLVLYETTTPVPGS
ncbi:MaoC family dehydratase [Actinoplanes sp. N902-109]|uniref:MaoC family dehydratase n=1 Tax=Actinoplanes sp. (strain N902-109) TaxID=649831 RepID=UPI0003295EBF|nr:MaoC family dehydratase [Actinoplanes sp. N902-109]AGL17096.1 dehydratase [Actinoplanes sp. N902-109]